MHSGVDCSGLSIANHVSLVDFAVGFMLSAVLATAFPPRYCTYGNPTCIERLPLNRLQSDTSYCQGSV